MPLDWKPYGVEPLVVVDGHMPLPFGVNGCTAPWLDIEEVLGTPDDVGLRPSAEPLLGGVKRLPTLVNDAVGCERCE